MVPRDFPEIEPHAAYEFTVGNVFPPKLGQGNFFLFLRFWCVVVI